MTIACLCCLPPVMNGHIKRNDSIKTKDDFLCKFNPCLKQVSLLYKITNCPTMARFLTRSVHYLYSLRCSWIINMLFIGWEVSIGKNCAQSLKCCQRQYTRQTQDTQFGPTRLVKNIFIFFLKLTKYLPEEHEFI